MKTYVTSLGCPKNLVDTEASVSLLQEVGCALTDDPAAADLLIVSACSFLDVAWRETVEEIERLADVKRRDGSKKLVVMGCLPKHRDEDLQKELPWVDRFVSAGAHSQLPGIIEAWRREEEVSRVTPASDFDRFAGFENRALLTPNHTAYVKIAEGCSRRCSFCAIPKIRGKMVCRPVASIVREVENLRARGVKEVSLLAQDITSYHADGRRFDELVSAIAATGIDWVRIFYVHPGSLTLDLARRLFELPSVCRYLEAPIQHASDRILKRMRRPYTRATLERLFTGIGNEFPDVRIRSEVIVGFPGEGDGEFQELKRFVETVEFASLGGFAYSPESNTPAARLAGAVSESIKAERAEELADIQKAISFGLHDAEIGSVHRVLVDRRRNGDADHSEYTYAGRYYGQALEVDGEVLLRGSGLRVGDFVTARITDSDVFDLHGEVA
jgi:ribosomal protein S12 methylthiotransferase